MHELHVGPEPCLSTEALITEVTRESAATRVMKQVASELRLLQKPFVTVLALIRPAVPVRLHVTIQRLFGGEPALALIARERSISSVGASVFDARAPRCETLLAHIAGEWSLACMRTHVNL